jgi:hypothetical protein
MKLVIKGKAILNPQRVRHRKYGEFASPPLRTHLRTIGKQLYDTTPKTAKVLQRQKAGVITFVRVSERPDKHGLSSVLFHNVRVDLWRELGSLLMRLAEGEDARRLFAQHKRVKPSKIGEHHNRALAYWFERAKNPAAKDTKALALARRMAPGGERLSAPTIRKYAQRHLLRCLTVLSGNPYFVLHFEGTRVRLRMLGPAVRPLWLHLSKKSARGRRIPPDVFPRLSDALYYQPKHAGDDPRQSAPAFPGMSMKME